MSIKVAKNDFTRKMNYFDTFTKIFKNVRDLDKLIVSKGFKIIAQSPKTRPIWSHWKLLSFDWHQNIFSRD